MDRKEFKDWYVNILDTLYQDGNAGFSILLISFPLLERYIRQKCKFDGNGLNKKCYQELISIFPKLNNINKSKLFWDVYRNGLLHQVAFRDRSKFGDKYHFLSNVIESAIEIDNDTFCVHPKKFSQRIIEIIESDFSTFEGKSSQTFPPPKVDFYSFNLSTICGTGSPMPSSSDIPWKKK